jgi:hypothetical protein
MNNGEPEIWIAHSEADRPAARLLSEGLDRQLISVLNNYVDYRLRSGEDERDVVTESILRADYVIVLLSAQSVADDLIAQIKRARSLQKQSCVVIGSDSASSAPLVSSADLAELISGLPHIYLAAKRTFVDLIDLIKKPTHADRQSASAKPAQRPKHYAVFISKKSQDYPFAKRVYNYLLANGIQAFLSEESLPELGSAEYMKAIDEALEHAIHLVVVGSKPEYLLSGWVEAEWRVFINEKRSGQKAGNVVTMVAGDLLPAKLPMSLRYYEVVPLTDDGLERLLYFVATERDQTGSANNRMESDGK